MTLAEVLTDAIRQLDPQHPNPDLWGERLAEAVEFRWRLERRRCAVIFEHDPRRCTRCPDAKPFCRSSCTLYAGHEGPHALGVEVLA